MKAISDAFATALAKEEGAFCTMFKVTRKDGFVFAATDHDQNIVFDGVTYLASSGYTATDIETKSELNVDNVDVHGFLVSPAITEADLLAGMWDFAAFEIFVVCWQDLTMGKMIERTGTLGEVTLERGQFMAELRGLMQAFTRTIGRIEGPACNANLGDARCTVDLTPFTVTGALTGINADSVTLYDTGRTEPGPSGGVAITNITNANPGVVSTVTAHGFTEGQAVTIADVVGMALVNVVVTVHNPSGNTFELDADTSDTAVYLPYVSGGTATPFGDSGYFDFGVITMTSGLNNGLSMEVKSYVAGQITLALPFPYALTIGDTYSMHAGCDKSLATCRDRFSNIVNMRAFPYLPGTDKLVQVGRRAA